MCLTLRHNALNGLARNNKDGTNPGLSCLFLFQCERVLKNQQIGPQGFSSELRALDIYLYGYTFVIRIGLGLTSYIINKEERSVCLFFNFFSVKSVLHHIYRCIYHPKLFTKEIRERLYDIYRTLRIILAHC